METEKKFLDEDIIMRQKKYRYIKIPADLSSAPRYIGDRYITFESAKILDMFYIYLPSGFSELSLSENKEHFLSEKKPDIVISNYIRRCFFLFQVISGKHKEAITESDSLIRTINMLYPQNVFYEYGTAQTESRKVVTWFEYKSFGLKIEKYNFLFLFEIDEKRYIVGKFICRFPDYLVWKPTMLDVMKTIRLVDT